MGEKVRGGATYEDLVRAPEDKIAELSGGELYLSPRPAPRHARVASAIVSDLYDAFDRGRSGPGGWWVLFEPELHLGADVLVPDIAAWRRSRLAELPDASWFDLEPDWICEILSPSTEQFDRAAKLPRYAEARIGWLWVVHPGERYLEVFRRGENGWVLDSRHGPHDVVRAVPFEAIEIDLSRIWP